ARSAPATPTVGSWSGSPMFRRSAGTAVVHSPCPTHVDRSCGWRAMSTPEHAAGSAIGQEPVAIVGIACLLPGADTPEQFWANLRSGADLRRPGGREVFGTDETVPGGWGDPEHRVTATRGGFVTEPPIDLSGLRIPAETLHRLDKVVRWPLHTVRRALADAGIAEDSPVLARTGLILGNYAFPTEASVRACVPLVREAVSTGLRQAG